MRLSALVLLAALLALPRPAAAGTELPGDSIYHLEGTWIDARGRSVPLASLRGEVLVVTMAYTTCGSACPVLFADLQRLERALSREVRARVRFVVFSLDPERDTPERMRAFQEARGLDPERWLLLAAGREQVREVAAVLGVRVRRDSRGDIAHSTVIGLVDPEGRIRQRFVLGEDPAAMAEALGKLVAAPERRPPGGGSGGRGSELEPDS